MWWRIIYILTLVSGTLFARGWEFSGSFEQTVWASDDIPAALLDFDDGALYAPRLTLNFDYQPSPYWYIQSKLRADRGFDAGTEPDGAYRIDTAILRYRPYGDNRLNFQIGKFATVVGNWAPEYEGNPFLLAPLPYASLTGVPTQNIAALSSQAIENRAIGADLGIHEQPENWSSIIWGPSYSNGFAIFGNVEKWDYALEIKNTSLGSRPEEWEFGQGDFSDPLYSARIGFRPDAAWAFGLSFSHGPFLDFDAFESLDPDFARGDFNQTLIGLDLRWSYRDWIVSGEAFYAQYDRDGEDLRAISYYLQSRYKIAPGVWVAGRIGQTLTNNVVGPSGEDIPWSPDIVRLELAAGWRITPELILQAQYTYTYVTNNISAPAPNLFGISFTTKF